MQGFLAALGPLFTVRFKGVGNRGWDKYDLKYEPRPWAVIVNVRLYRSFFHPALPRLFAIGATRARQGHERL